MVALGMQNPKDNDAFAFDAIEKLVGKTSRHQPTEVAVVNGRTIGLGFEQDDGSFYFIHKLITLPRLLCVVPPARFGQVGFGARADEDDPVHAAGFLRMRASTSRQEAPALGDCR